MINHFQWYWHVALTISRPRANETSWRRCLKGGVIEWIRISYVTYIQGDTKNGACGASLYGTLANSGGFIVLILSSLE